MPFIVNDEIEVSLVERGYDVIQEQKEGSNWRAIKRVSYAGEDYKVLITNNIVVRQGCFMEEFILEFSNENSLSEVKVRCTYLSPEHLLTVVDNILDHISKYVAVISDIPEDVESLVLPMGI